MEFKVRATQLFICVYVKAKFILALKKEIACVSCSMFSLQPSRPGCDNLSFLVVPDWYVNGCSHVLELVQSTNSVYSMCKVLQVSEKYVQTTR
jgi:hypothetical protein